MSIVLDRIKASETACLKQRIRELEDQNQLLMAISEAAAEAITGCLIIETPEGRMVMVPRAAVGVVSDAIRDWNAAC